MKMKCEIYNALLSVVILAMLTACGFQLRGSGPSNLSVQSVYINATAQNELANELKTSFSQLGVTVTDDAISAQYILKLAREQLSRRILSVSPSTGKVTEYEILYDTSISVLDNTGSVLSENQTVRVRTDLSVDEDSALGKFDEERLLAQELRLRAANQIMRYFQAVIQ